MFKSVTRYICAHNILLSKSGRGLISGIWVVCIVKKELKDSMQVQKHVHLIGIGGSGMSDCIYCLTWDVSCQDQI